MKVFSQSTTEHRITLTEKDLIDMLNQHLTQRGLIVPTNAEVFIEGEFGEVNEFDITVAWSEIEEVA